MKIIFWNIRGMGNAGRRKLLIELIAKYSFDCICLQETIKTSFKQRELDILARQRCWPTGSPAQVSEPLTSLAKHPLVLPSTH